MFSSSAAWLARRLTGFLLASVLLGAMGMVGVISAAPTAHAASVTATSPTGYQLTVVTTAASVRVQGKNQNGALVTHCFNTPNRSNPLAGWFWQGQVSLTAYTRPNCTGTQLCSLIVSLPVNPPSGWLTVDLLCAG